VTLRDDLLFWYDEKARDLPWRRTRDPYAIWVSEVMLQQTRVDTVLRYYDHFLERFPTTQALATASEDEVMAAWSGLGYYRRARLLHAGVREVVARYGGEVPSEPEARRALPGVGRYTAGAIGSIAFERQEPIVDGNVARVLCRIHAIDTPPEAPATQIRLWQEAEALARGPRPGALNQALMELGALVCAKAAPLCAECPVRSACAAYASGRQSELPSARKRKPPKPWTLVGVVATSGTARAPSVLLTRGEGALFGGLWNLPMMDGDDHAAASALAAQSSAELLSGDAPLARVRHVLSHRAIDLAVWPARARKLERAVGKTHKLVPLAELSELGTSQLTRKALAAAGLVVEAALERRARARRLR
jgi:A/G-specific adenine glycosylase